MEYHVALAPELGLSPADFAAAWNETPDCLQVARAEVTRIPGTQFGPDALAVALTVAGNLALGVIGNALYDLIRTTLARRGVRQQVEITALEQRDGSRVLVVTIREG